MDWKWIIGTVIGTILTVAIIPLIRNYYKIFSRLTRLEIELPSSNRIEERLIKLEKDTEFTTKIIWQFLISKVHNDDDEMQIDALLDKWKQNKLRKADEINELITGLTKITQEEMDNSKKAAAELLLKMLDKGIGIITKM